MSIICTNCGKTGHYYKSCVEPVTSFGIILVQVRNITKEQLFASLANDTTINGLETADFRFLMVRRKDSLGYIELLRGKYEPTNTVYIKTLIEQTSLQERQNLLSNDFITLWEKLWSGPVSKPYRHEYEPAKNKFDGLVNSGILKELIDDAKSAWIEPEWGFPKGRRGPGESELRCAIREFWEETGIISEKITLARNVLPLEESFFGSNKIHYRHKYYIAFTFDDINPTIQIGNNIMEREIGDIRWFTIGEALDMIRPYNIEKKEIILHVSSILRNFCFW